MALVGAVLVALINSRLNRLQAELNEYRARENRIRTDLSLMGQGMSELRSDNSKLVLLVNQLFEQFKEATGQEPKVDLGMVKHMIDLYYVTGQLPKLDPHWIAEVKKAIERD